jgi:RNA polymerase sigma-70 factor, ECF subfamily
MDESDKVLLDAAKAGDSRAIAAILERYAPAVFRFGMKMCRDPEDAKDIVQETLLAASRGLGDFRGGSSPATWLYTVARSFCIKKRRRSKFAPTEVSLEDGAATDVAAQGPLPDETAASRELGAVLDDALAELDPSYREVLILRDVEGLTAPEVAEVLGVSTDAVKSRLHRARADLRARLEPRLPRDEQLGRLPAAPGCPEILSVFSRYLEGDIGPAECAAMDAHVLGCARCRTACSSLKHTLSLCRTASTAEVPAEIQALVKQAVRELAAQSGTVL